DEVVAACLAGDEEGAVAAAMSTGVPATIYASAKRAQALWVRREAPTANWAGSGITLNVICPGVVITPMTAPMLEGDDGPALVAHSRTSLGGPWRADQVAPLLAWFVSAENAMTTGQCLFMDGGIEAAARSALV